MCLAALVLLTLPLPCLCSDDTEAEEPACRDEMINLLVDRRHHRRLGCVAWTTLDCAASTTVRHDSAVVQQAALVAAL